MPKVKFQAWLKEAEDTGITPVAAARKLPAWFTKFPKFVDGDTKWKFDRKSTSNSTIKRCPPFLDSMLAGYMITLTADVLVTQKNGFPLFSWALDNDLVSGHSMKQIPAELVPKGFTLDAYKFTNFWSVQLPAGYSALYVHPLNRQDLPFHVLSGFVDNDSYHMPVHFPFVMREGFEGIIEAGTPIAQIIPVKRESWKHEVIPCDPAVASKIETRFFTKVFSVYKLNYWHRKEYK